jgi:class 3 adenylate cyclase/HAMP domain-containing protein
MSAMENDLLQDILKKIPFIPKAPEKKKAVKVRKVYFGLRIRMLGLFSLVMLGVVLVLSTTMFIIQATSLRHEKYNKAGALTKILSGPAEFYLDKDAGTTRSELSLKYEMITREATLFKQFNTDIEKIIMADHLGNVIYSTDRWDIKLNHKFRYILDSLEQEEEKLAHDDFTHKERNKKGKVTARYRYRAITYPVFKQQGLAVDVLDDYDNKYRAFHGGSREQKTTIYRNLWKKYRRSLPSDFNPGSSSGPIIDESVERAWDIDFLFHELFTTALNESSYKVTGENRTLLNNSWLYDSKKRKVAAYQADKPAEARKIKDSIESRIETLAGETRESRRLGALAVLFKVDSINRDAARSIKLVFYISLVILVIGSVAVLFVINYIIRNLKELERWALQVSEGDIDNRAQIETKDEIGRLSDIFNYMINEIKTKYHLEKFVSRSTKTMINKKKGTRSSVKTGQTGKRDLAFIFSDVRGFTSFSEKNDPEVVLEVLNFYLDLQAKIIKRKKGDIDDYVGDEIMAHFGGEKRADTVVETALEIMREINEQNRKRKAKKLPVFEVGIGIHCGEVVVGNIGSRFRMDFACIGDAVNLSSRLCSNAKPGEILVSRVLFNQVTGSYRTKRVSPISVKGKAKPISIVSLVVE